LSEKIYIEDISDYSGIDYDKIAEKTIAKLNDKEKQLYELRYIENKSLAELSEILEVSFTAVAQRLFRLREKVKEIAEEEMKGEVLF
jgi:RNA polymerase sigma factor (sigma-70 family)